MWSTLTRFVKHTQVLEHSPLCQADFPWFLRLSEEESSSLLDLITCKAPATAAGVKFVSLGLCMFIACNSLISTPESEKRAVAWIHWLVEQAAHFEQVCLSVILLCFNLIVSVISLNLKSNYVMRPIFDVVLNLVFEFDWWLNKHQFLLSQVTGLSASFGEMLLLMAIHFHSNQLSAIGDLVCQTLGMKIVIRTNSMSRKISHVFTHEIFNEQV